MDKPNQDIVFLRNEIDFGEHSIELGRGSTSAVFKATLTTDKGETKVAVKMYQKIGYKEVNILKDLDHKNIIKFYGLLDHIFTFGIVLELASEGNLGQFLARFSQESKDAGLLSRLPKRQFVQWSIDIASALHYLHKKNIIHKDITSPNVLLSDDKENGFNVLKLCDVGSCKELKDANSTFVELGVEFIRRWAAPEVLQYPTLMVSKKSDIYSFCVVLWELWTCQEPWKGFRYFEMAVNVVNGNLLEIPNDFPEVLHPMIKQCWSRARERRCNIDEVLEYLEKFRRFLKDNEKGIPHLIAARGKTVEKAYIEALKEGQVEVNLGMLKVIGQEGAGKTCLINACLGKKTKVEELNKWTENPSGDRVNPILLYRKFAEEDVNRRIENDEEVVPTESEPYFSTKDVEQESSAREEKGPTETVAETNDVGKKPSAQGVNTRKPAKTKNVNKKSTTEEELNGNASIYVQQKLDKDIIENISQTQKEELSPMENMFDIWDHGGQLIYHGIHRIFVTLHALYLVVFDMSKNLYDPAIVIDSNGKKRQHHWTNLQFLLSSILSVYSHSRILIESMNKQVFLPAILIVGTHKGKLGDTEEKQNEESEKVLNEIKRALAEKPYEKHVYGYFAVENSRETTDKSFSDLKEVIQDLMNHLKKPIPLKWMRFRCELYSLRKDELICSLKEVKVLASKNGIVDESQQLILLNFLYDLGDIIYMPDNKLLKDQVVLDPMSLVKIVTAFVTVVPPDFPTAMYSEAFRNLNKGILDEMLLHKLWKEQGVDSKKFNYLVDLMIRFGFICEKMTSSTSQTTVVESTSVVMESPTSAEAVAKRSFFVPLRLAVETSSSEGNSVHDECQVISIFYDLCGYLPDVLFPYIVIDFLNKYQNATGDDPKLSHDLAELYFDQFHHVILSLVNFVTKQDERKFLLKVTIKRRVAIKKISTTEREAYKRVTIKDGVAINKTCNTECKLSPEVCKQVLSTLEMSFKHSKDGGRRGISFRRCIPCDCSDKSEKKHMQMLGDFQSEMLACHGDGMDVTRYKQLFGNEASRELMDLAKKLGNEWEQLAIYLGYTKVELDDFKRDNRFNMLGAIFNMLDSWHKTVSVADKSRHLQLTLALRQANRNDLADKVEGDASRELMDLAKNLGSEWEQLAIYLGFTKANLDCFKHDNCGNILLAMFTMLDAWYKETSGTEMSKNSQLSEALRMANRNDLADEVERKL
ncbi:uncharacterized protein [Antedon mediterranea]|uniref:uncharacterized protein n=1 Tax=Antedon mediterranea TaxID=105859 RepID=UPI003AF50BC7